MSTVPVLPNSARVVQVYKVYDDGHRTVPSTDCMRWLVPRYRCRHKGKEKLVLYSTAHTIAGTLCHSTLSSFREHVRVRVPGVDCTTVQQAYKHTVIDKLARLPHFLVDAREQPIRLKLSLLLNPYSVW